MNNNMVFTTKRSYEIGPIILGFIVVFIVGFVIVSMFPNAIGWAVTMAFVIYTGMCVRRHRQITRSYIDIYNDHIEGLTVPEKFFTIDDTSTKFFVVYKDITHVDSQQNMVKIYTAGACYLVQAFQCEQQVIDIINQQQKLDIQQ